MELQLDTHQLKVIIQEAARLGALQALSQTGQTQPFINKSAAFRRLSRSRVERHIVDGLIAIRKDGDHSSAWRIDRLEIEAIVSATEIFRYL